MACKWSVESRGYKACALCSDKNICENSTVIDNETILLSASEACNKAKDNLKVCSTKELVEINKKISNAVKNCKFSISGNGVLQLETKERLAQLGYKVQTGSQYNESYWYISWDE